MKPQRGDLRVWHIPQVPGKPFAQEVPDLETAALLLEALARYDQFQFDHNIKPDFANAQGLVVYDPQPGEPEENAWVDWHCEEGYGLTEHLRSKTDLSTLVWEGARQEEGAYRSRKDAKGPFTPILRKVGVMMNRRGERNVILESTQASLSAMSEERWDRDFGAASEKTYQEQAAASDKAAERWELVQKYGYHIPEKDRFVVRVSQTQIVTEYHGSTTRWRRDTGREVGSTSTSYLAPSLPQEVLDRIQKLLGDRKSCDFVKEGIRKAKKAAKAR